MSKLYPMLFEPVLKGYLWGGRNLARLGRSLPAGEVVAESWEIAGHEDGTTVVTNGVYAGQPLTQVQAELGLDLIGTNSAWAHARGKFPLLIKLLDAEQALSVQVHPDDDYAHEHEGNELGKTEMWVVLSGTARGGADPGRNRGNDARDVTGSAPRPVTPSHISTASRCTPGTISACPPAPFMRSWMACIIAEIQQNSNTTYRVYDWNRVGTDGKPRELHLDKALHVIDFEAVEPGVCPAQTVEQGHGYRRSLLCDTRYFVTERVDLDEGATYRGDMRRFDPGDMGRDCRGGEGGRRARSKLFVSPCCPRRSAHSALPRSTAPPSCARTSGNSSPEGLNTSRAFCLHVDDLRPTAEVCTPRRNTRGFHRYAPRRVGGVPPHSHRTRRLRCLLAGNVGGVAHAPARRRLSYHFDNGLKTLDIFDVMLRGLRRPADQRMVSDPDTGLPSLCPASSSTSATAGVAAFPINWIDWPSLGFAHFVMDTRGQGSAWIQGDTPDPEPAGTNPHYPGFMTRGILDPQTYYYRRVFTDAVRAVEAALSHPLVDPGRGRCDRRQPGRWNHPGGRRARAGLVKCGHA